MQKIRIMLPQTESTKTLHIPTQAKLHIEPHRLSKLFKSVSLGFSIGLCIASAEPQTATSMFMTADGKQIANVESKNGDLYKTMGHHGPAVENRWVAYRIYFNRTLSIDILSKFQPRLELRDSQWYTLEKPNLSGKNYGQDNYKVADTVGLGGLRLWDHSRKGKDKTMFLDVSKADRGLRSAQVIQDQQGSVIRMLNKGVSFQGEQHDVEFSLRVFDGERYAQVTAKVLSDMSLPFVTGITVHEKLKAVERDSHSLLAWGDYDSPAAGEDFDVGTGLVFDPVDVETMLTKKDELLIISKPLKQFSYLITSANAKEATRLNTLDHFRQHVAELSGALKKLNEAKR